MIIPRAKAYYAGRFNVISIVRRYSVQASINIPPSFGNGETGVSQILEVGGVIPML
jgi:hypothetical protein